MSVQVSTPSLANFELKKPADIQSINIQYNNYSTSKLDLYVQPRNYQSIQPYFMTTNQMQYFAMLPMATSTSSDSTFISPHEYGSNSFYLFPENIDVVCLSHGFGNVMYDSSNNISDNQICSRTQIEANSCSESRTPVIAEPIILSFKGKSPSLV
jgi:hypothetical protein